MTFLKPAETETGWLKVAFYGSSGSGKTFTALKCACALGKTAIVDTEKGSDYYASDFKFDRANTRSIKDINSILQEAVANGYKCLIIDSITHIWESAQNAFIEKYKNSNKKWAVMMREEAKIPWFAWKEIKRPYKDLIASLLNAPLHVFICGRLANIYDTSNPNELVKTGETMKAEGETPYEPAILIKMTCAVGKNEHKAIVEKDRSNTITGKTFVNPGIEMLEPVTKKFGIKHTAIASTEEATEKDRSTFEGKVNKPTPQKDDNKDPNSIYHLLDNFKSLKEKSIKITGTDQWYYHFLESLGFKKSNKIPHGANRISVNRSMLDALTVELKSVITNRAVLTHGSLEKALEDDGAPGLDLMSWKQLEDFLDWLNKEGE